MVLASVASPPVSLGGGTIGSLPPPQPTSAALSTMPRAHAGCRVRRRFKKEELMATHFL